MWDELISKKSVKATKLSSEEMAFDYSLEERIWFLSATHNSFKL